MQNHANINYAQTAAFGTRNQFHSASYVKITKNKYLADYIIK